MAGEDEAMEVLELINKYISTPPDKPSRNLTTAATIVRYYTGNLRSACLFLKDLCKEFYGVEILTSIK